MNRLLTAIFLTVLMFAVSLAKQSVPKDTRITLQRSYCYGYGECFSYTLTISSDGAVEFVPVRLDTDEKSQPPFRSGIEVEKVKKLILEFEKVNFFSLSDSYTESDKRCTETATHHPYVITSITLKGKSKRVLHYLGCRGIPDLERLTVLEDKIDGIAGTQGILEQLRNSGGSTTPNSTTTKPADITSGLLSGLVLDEAGARVAGLTIHIEGEDFQKSIPSDHEGHYEIRLPKGRYTIKVTEGGWHKYESRPILIHEGKVVKLNIALKGVRQDLSHP